MIAYTGIETVSNLAEEARDPSRTIPASIRLVAIAVFAIYFTLPLVALSALPVYKDVGGADHAGVGGDEEDGGGEDADVDLRGAEHPAVEPEALDQPEHGIVLRNRPSPGGDRASHVVASNVLVDGQRGEGDQREREVDREDGDRDEADGGGTSVDGSRASSARFETVSIPV